MPLRSFTFSLFRKTEVYKKPESRKPTPAFSFIKILLSDKRFSHSDMLAFRHSSIHKSNPYIRWSVPGYPDFFHNIC